MHLMHMDKNLQNIIRELNELDSDMVEVDGSILKPSQCYHFGTDPVHVLFNTNCPDSLQQKVKQILAKHLPAYESSSPQ